MMGDIQVKFNTELHINSGKYVCLLYNAWVKLYPQQKIGPIFCPTGHLCSRMWMSVCWIDC